MYELWVRIWVLPEQQQGQHCRAAAGAGQVRFVYLSRAGALATLRISKEGLRMNKGYGTFCPVAKAAEVLAERWTLLLMRDLLLGSRHFNDFRRALPPMSPGLITKRLQSLMAHGIVQRVPGSDARHPWQYRLTPAGEALRPIVMALGHWGARWVGSRLRDDELDAGLLMWDVRRFVRLDEFPDAAVVIHFRFRDAREGERAWWLVVEEGTADLCRDDPGRELTLVVDSTVRALTDVWGGERTPEEVLLSRELRVDGASRDAQRLWCWLGTSAFAPTRRERAARLPISP
jgi:DNA-binding HxlR family transcriptional regulator